MFASVITFCLFTICSIQANKICNCVPEKECDLNIDCVPLPGNPCYSRRSVPNVKCPNAEEVCCYEEEDGVEEEKVMLECGRRGRAIAPVGRILASKDHSFLCGATLFSHTLALTSEKCGRAMEEEKGPWMLRLYLPASKNVTRTIHSWMIKESSLSVGGVTLLLLEESFDKNLEFPCPPSRDQQYINERCKLYGWGSSHGGLKTRKLRAVIAEILKEKNCPAAHENGFNLHNSGVICIGGYAYKGICPGDAGGALVCDTMDSRVVLAGVFSYSEPERCNKPSDHDFVLDVRHLLNWIRDAGKVLLKKAQTLQN